MKKLKTITPILLLVAALFSIGQSCTPTPEPEPEPESCSNNGISYKIDGTLYEFDNAQVTAEIHNDAAIGKFYDIWTDQVVNGQNGFYYHSTITDTDESAPFASDWFTTNEVGNISFLNNKTNVNITFTIIRGANAVGDPVEINFSGSYDDNGTTHQITDGKICTDIDIVQ